VSWPLRHRPDVSVDAVRRFWPGGVIPSSMIGFTLFAGRLGNFFAFSWQLSEHCGLHLSAARQNSSAKRHRAFLHLFYSGAFRKREIARSFSSD